MPLLASKLPSVIPTSCLFITGDQKLFVSLRRNVHEDTSANLLMQSEGPNSRPTDVLERYALNNSETATANTPDEVLAMIFEACMHLEHRPNEHYGDLLSHVSRHWRTIALSTPGLWTQIRYIDYPVTTPVERVTTYLQRSKLAPVDIYVELSHREYHVPPLVFQSLLDHITHCSRLCFVNVTGELLESVLKQVSLQSHAPALRSFQLLRYRGYQMNAPSIPGSAINFSAPHLEILHLEEMAINDIQNLNVSAFKSVTHLRLDNINIDDMEFMQYIAFRDFLMAMQSLTHLELKLYAMVSHTDENAIVIPNLEFLHVELALWASDLKTIIQNIHAPALQALSLAGWGSDKPALDPSSLPTSHFPSLRHVIFLGYLASTLAELRSFGLTFPDIERLTFQAHLPPPLGDIGDILSTIVAPVPKVCAAAGESVMWQKLRSIAVSTVLEPFDGEFLHGLIHDWQKSGHSLNKLFIPNTCVAQADVEGMKKLRELVDIEDFKDDLPILIQEMH
ncbi:hypothetical protein HWV62_29244 [Athelia sp. TMB]|nr:hypothetical protein HWV62_29244 [Athelia sp. TMB]